MKIIAATTIIKMITIIIIIIIIIIIVIIIMMIMMMMETLCSPKIFKYRQGPPMWMLITSSVWDQAALRKHKSMSTKLMSTNMGTLIGFKLIKKIMMTS